MCVTACPTAAINQSASSFADIRTKILEGGAPVSFACNQSGENADIGCMCLATIPWEVLAAAALTNGAVVKATACRECPHTALVSQVKQTIRELRTFLGEDRFKQCVSQHDNPSALRSAGLDKRQAFQRIASGITQGAETALSGEEKPTMSCYRALLHEVISAQSQATENTSGSTEQSTIPLVTWHTLIEDGNCHACEICTKMCPHKALELHISADEPQFLVQDASKCTQCGLCYVSCPNDNLGGWDTVQTDELPALKKWPIQVQLCEKCGRAFKPTEEDQVLCTVCSRPKFGLSSHVAQSSSI